MPLLQLQHTGVTWSEQLDDEPTSKDSLAHQAQIAKRGEYKARESVSMYLEDANKTLQVVEALRERRATKVSNYQKCLMPLSTAMSQFGL